MTLGLRSNDRPHWGFLRDILEKEVEEGEELD